MKSKIIKLVDRMKDDEDLRLEALFRSEAVNDDGFSDRVMKRIRWRLHVRRYALPVAMLIGGLVAVKPVVDLLLLASQLVTVLPQELRSAPLEAVPHLYTVVSGIGVAALMAVCIRLLED